MPRNHDLVEGNNGLDSIAQERKWPIIGRTEGACAIRGGSAAIPNLGAIARPTVDAARATHVPGP